MLLHVHHRGRYVAIPSPERCLVAEVAHRAAALLDAGAGPWTLQPRGAAKGLAYDLELWQAATEGASVQLAVVR